MLKFQVLEDRNLMAADTFTVNVDIPGDNVVDVIVADNQPAGVEIVGRGITTHADEDPEVGSVLATSPVAGIDSVIASGNAFSSRITKLGTADVNMSAKMSEVGDFEPLDNLFAAMFRDQVVADNVGAGVEVVIDGQARITTLSDNISREGMIFAWDVTDGGLFAMDVDRMFKMNTGQSPFAFGLGGLGTGEITLF